MGGDDAKLGHLRQTARDLSEILKKTPAKASPFALVAFDPDVPSTDPNHRRSGGNAARSGGRPTSTHSTAHPSTVFRAMLLDALIRAAGDNDTVAAAFVASARNVLPFMEVGEEREIWAEIVGEIEGKVEARAEREWATPDIDHRAGDQIRFTFCVAEIHLSPAEGNRARLASVRKLQAAAGPISKNPDVTQIKGSVNTGGNPHSLPHDQSQQNGPTNSEHGRPRLSVGRSIGRLEAFPSKGATCPEGH